MYAAQGYPRRGRTRRLRGPGRRVRTRGGPRRDPPALPRPGRAPGASRGWPGSAVPRTRSSPPARAGSGRMPGIAQFMTPRLSPNPRATAQSSRERPRSTGRARSPRTTALVTSRSHTIAVGVTSSKRSLATPAPNWTAGCLPGPARPVRRPGENGESPGQSREAPGRGRSPARCGEMGQRRERETMSTILLVGTRKGMWIGAADDQRHDSANHPGRTSTWRRSTPASSTSGASVHACSRGRPRCGWARRCVVPTTSARGGRKLTSSSGAVRFPDGTDAKVERIWQLVTGAEDGVVYAG